MNMPLQIAEQEQRLILSAAHSSLEFATDGGGFRLFIRGRLVLQTGAGWGAPCHRLSLWQAEGDTALLTFMRGTHGYGRLRLRAWSNGWQLAWDQRPATPSTSPSASIGTGKAS